MALFEVEDTEESLQEETQDIPREYAIDFDTGQLKRPRQIVEGNEAIKVWAWLALNTARYRYSYYPWEYGSDLENLIGSSYSKQYETSRVSKMLTECVCVNSHIKGIKSLECTFEEGVLNASFTILTDCGDIDMEVKEGETNV